MTSLRNQKYNKIIFYLNRCNIKSVKKNLLFSFNNERTKYQILENCDDFGPLHKFYQS